MWAMIPMLRVRASGNSRMTGASAMICSQGVAVRRERSRGEVGARRRTAGRGRPAATNKGTGLPAVVGERLVALGHLVHVFPALHRGADAVRGVHQLVGEASRHGLLPPLARVA